MKHIQKRFYLQRKSIEFNPKEIDGFINIGNEFDDNLLKGREKELIILCTSKDVKIGSSMHKVNGNTYIFPLPDPTLIYFHSAQQHYSQIEKIKNKLLKSLDLHQPVDEIGLHEYFHFYSITSGFVIFLFTSIESFINQRIPDNYEFKKITNRRTETYNKTQIQEVIDFKTKITIILPEITGINFFTKPTPLNQHIWNLKKFRDSLIHAKELDPVLPYNHIVKSSLNFNYKKTLEAVGRFMNFYQKNYITECKCGEDF